MNATLNIVLLGGGYVSVWAYRSLIKSLRSRINKGRVRLIIVSPTTHHYFHGWTAEALTGVLQAHNRLSSLQNVLSRAEIIIGCAQEVDATNNVVTILTRDGARQVLSYDHLVIGTGSFDNETIPGLKDHGYRIKSHEDFECTKRAVRSLIRKAGESGTAAAQGMLTFIIAGGGFTGIEIAANLAEFVQLYKKQYPALCSVQPSIILVHSRDRILSQLHGHFQRLVTYAEKQLNRYEVRVINSCRIAAVKPEGALLDDGSFIKSSMVISTIGQTRSVIKGTECMQRDTEQRLCTNTFLQVSKQQNIWGGGDACNVPHCITRQACPSNALWAIKHGDYAGKNIARAIKGQPLKQFLYKGLGQSASLGQGRGIAELYGMQFTGWMAWIMRWFFFNYFMPSRKAMLRTTGDWLFLLVRRQRKDVWKENRLSKSTHAELKQAFSG